MKKPAVVMMMNTDISFVKRTQFLLTERFLPCLPLFGQERQCSTNFVIWTTKAVCSGRIRSTFQLTLTQLISWIPRRREIGPVRVADDWKSHTTVASHRIPLRLVLCGLFAATGIHFPERQRADGGGGGGGWMKERGSAGGGRQYSKHASPCHRRRHLRRH